MSVIKPINSIVSIKKELCYGCGLCKNVCSKQAISFDFDKKGFLYPNVDFDECINCGLCLKKCPSSTMQKGNRPIHSFAALNNNITLQMNSSSAGVFSLLASAIFDEGGVVVGCSWKGKDSVCHIISDNKADIELFRGSKYLQSDISDLYYLIKKILEEGRPVLFSGTPCQVDGLRIFLDNKYQNIYYIDLVCHGVPSSKFLSCFIAYFEKKCHAKIARIDFRHKTLKNGQYLTRISFLKNKHDQIFYWQETFFMYLFMKGYGFRESCYNCKYACEKRCGDITLGDFWGVKRMVPNIDDKYGVSLVLINSQHGHKLFDLISTKLSLVEVDVDEAISLNAQLNHPCEKPKDFLSFDNLLENEDALGLMKFYKEKCKNRVRIRLSFVLRKIMPKKTSLFNEKNFS